MNAGLLGSVLIVASCSEDVIINNGTEGLENFAPDSKELTQYTVTASIQQLNSLHVQIFRRMVNTCGMQET